MEMLNLDRPPRSILAGLMTELMPEDGIIESGIPGLQLARKSSPSKRGPVVYQPSLYIVAQGSKQAYIGDQVFTYDAWNYLVLAVPLPIEGCVMRATPEEPYLAIRVGLDLGAINELLLALGEPLTSEMDKPAKGIYVSQMDAELSDGVFRLLRSLADSQKAKVLGPMIMKEMLFNVLRGEQGHILRSFARQDRHNHQIARVLHFIQKNYQQTLEIHDLTEVANMSASSLHTHFKTVTDVSPLQYIKQIRLHEARRMIQQESHNVSDAAYKVGYSSPSQFSREYRRMFGEAPSRDVNL